MIDVLEALRAGLAPHYTVEREIGAGGMARVYLAHERHPPRKVAVKVMAPELSTPGFRERFIREVELTSKLSHPHIVPILAAEECLFVPDGPDGLCYYVMPYVEGESLRLRLARERRLPLDDALRILFHVADALSYAHAQGVIHRDIKPENILLSGDHAFVADFGIARAVSAAGVQTLTGVGQLIGSPAYMSPEQLGGSRTIDARTDVYSLACVLYELLCGQPPLLDLAEGSVPGRAALDAVLRAQGVGHVTARLLKEAMGRALAASPADRFASVDDFVASLRDATDRRAEWLGGRVPRPGRKAAIIGGAVILGAAGLALLAPRGAGLDPRRVAVAGFEDLSGDPSLASLGHLAADWITQGLAQSGAVEVVPATGAGHLDAAAIQELAARTGAGTVVSGSYYTSGDSVWFQLQIIDAERGTVQRVVEPVGGPARAPLRGAEAVRARVTAVFDSLFPHARN
jgi:serine/threonine-protein kinase